MLTYLPPIKLLLVLSAVVPTFIRQVHAQQSPSVMMPFSFSTPAAALFLTLLVSDVANSNKGRSLVQALPDFEVVDDGFCRDVNGNSYDNIGFTNGRFGAVVTSKDDCARLCVPCACEVTNKQFRGFVYIPTPTLQFSCYCVFDDDGVAFTANECKNIDAGKVSLESATFYFLGGAGDGEIDGTNGDTSVECSKTVTTFSTEDCPSDVPSESPSDAPIIAPSESPSDAPLESPSDAPLESPSDAPSIAPSEYPSDTPSESASPTAKAKARKKSRGPKAPKAPKASSLQVQAMKSGGSPSFSPLTIVGVCGTFAVITFMLVDLI